MYTLTFNQFINEINITSSSSSLSLSSLSPTSGGSTWLFVPYVGSGVVLGVDLIVGSGVVLGVGKTVGYSFGWGDSQGNGWGNGSGNIGTIENNDIDDTDTDDLLVGLSVR